MVSLDRIKLISPLHQSVIDFDESYFTNIQDSSGKELDWILDSRKIDNIPYLLYIKFDFRRGELVLEFSAKVLGNRYPEGITSENISIALVNLSEFVEFDESYIHKWADVISCDVKSDLYIKLDKVDYQNLPQHLKYQKNFDWKYYNSGIVFRKSLATKSRNYVLKFYDKSIEIEKRKNEPFLSTLEDSVGIIDAFEGRTRIELELKSKFLIRKYFNTEILSVENILGNRGDPLKKVCNEIFDLDGEKLVSADISTLSEYKQYLFVKECDFDLANVESTLRKWASPKTNIRSAIRPYKKIIANHNSQLDLGMGLAVITNIISI